MPALSQRHSFHLVDPSPWPILMAFGVLGFPMGFVLFFHGFVGGWSLIEAALYQMVFIAFLWWRDVIREGVFEGKHTAKVIRGLRLGMLLFIVSEVMFFFAFFWGFFYFAFNPAMALGYAWPPIGMQTLNGFEIPFLNTIVLLSSGATITWSHHALVYGSRREAMIALGVTIALAVYFTALQYFEYKEAPYSISDSVYGSIFYLTTGFHGFHVFIGTCFLAVCLLRLFLNHFSPTQHIGFEAAAWYWHFVDVVWLFLFICVYLWSVL